MPISLFYRYLFILELFTAESLFIYRLRKRKKFVLYFLAGAAADVAIASFMPLIYDMFYTDFIFLLLFAVTVAMLKLCCDESWKNVFFCAIAAYTMQHFAYSIANLLMSLIEWGRSPIFGMYFEGSLAFSSFDMNTLLNSLIYIFAYFVSYTLLYLVFVRKIKRNENFKIRSTAIMLCMGVALVVDIVIGSVVIYYGDDNSIVTSILLTVYESFCGIFLLYILFGLVRTGELENELDLAHRLLREKVRQLELSKESVTLINLKCHDLRHQIRAIGEGKGLSSEAVKEIESAISIYDAKVRTGNEVLDIILTEKSLKCAIEGIALTCVADGKSLDFMDKTDIYSLFGNALDNAIEAVTRLKEDKRNIGVVVRRLGNMVSINIHNYYEGDIALDGDGLPVTTKRDRNYHGFGMKSIKQIAEKYNGSCKVSVKNNTFALNVLVSETEKDGKTPV